MAENKSNIRGPLIIGGVIILVVVVLGLLIPRSGMITDITKGLASIEKLTELIHSQDHKITQLNEELRVSNLIMDSIRKDNSVMFGRILFLEAKMDSLPEIIIPVISDKIPEDFDECIEELADCRESAAVLVEIVENKDLHIYYLNSIRLDQHGIIENQAYIIEIQEKNMEKLSEVCESYLHEARRTKLIGYGVGIIGLLLALL